MVEADGGQHVEQAASDEKRTAFLEAREFFGCYGFWNDEILVQTDDVLDVIFHALNETPHPNPRGVRE